MQLRQLSELRGNQKFTRITYEIKANINRVTVLSEFTELKSSKVKPMPLGLFLYSNEYIGCSKSAAKLQR